jgi:hypothetical protein
MGASPMRLPLKRKIYEEADRAMTVFRGLGVPPEQSKKE